MSECSQWLFPIPALLNTPTATTSNVTLEKELYDRARGVEFLFRLGSSLALPSSAIFTAATWFHRFYMRHSMEDYHRQDVAATCIFLATKTEECGRKLRDVSRVCQSKSTGIDVAKISPDSQEVEDCQKMILLTEEVLLEAICFDFVTGSPHAELVDLFDACGESCRDYAWSIAHDSYRTPLCLLYPPKILAIACYLLGQHMSEDPSTSLDDRISRLSPSLLTPPSHNDASPDVGLYTNDHPTLSKEEVTSVADALSILLEFYAAQDQNAHPYLVPLVTISAPSIASTRPKFFTPVNQIGTTDSQTVDPSHITNNTQGPSPNSSQGGCTPAQKTKP